MQTSQSLSPLVSLCDFQPIETEAVTLSVYFYIHGEPSVLVSRCEQDSPSLRPKPKTVEPNDLPLLGRIPLMSSMSLGASSRTEPGSLMPYFLHHSTEADPGASGDALRGQTATQSRLDLEVNVRASERNELPLPESPVPFIFLLPPERGNHINPPTQLHERATRAMSSCPIHIQPSGTAIIEQMRVSVWMACPGVRRLTVATRLRTRAIPYIKLHPLHCP